VSQLSFFDHTESLTYIWGMELLIEFWNKLKSGIKVLLNYLYIILGMGVFFTLGYYYNTLKELSKLGKPEFITREEVTVAIDENNNFMIIDKTKGTYIILEDQIGTVIFNVYAKNLWGQHNAPKKWVQNKHLRRLSFWLLLESWVWVIFFTPI